MGLALSNAAGSQIAFGQFLGGWHERLAMIMQELIAVHATATSHCLPHVM
jgi:hypothetical protein